MWAAVRGVRQREVGRLVSSLAWVGVTAKRTVRIEAVLLERTTALLNDYELDIDAPRQFEVRKIRRARVVEDLTLRARSS